jgi:hypothetical protein
MKRSRQKEARASEQPHPEMVTKDNIDLSPEGINNRSSAKTEVLNEMLERERLAYSLRYWGINE